MSAGNPPAGRAAAALAAGAVDGVGDVDAVDVPLEHAPTMATADKTSRVRARGL